MNLLCFPTKCSASNFFVDRRSHFFYVTGYCVETTEPLPPTKEARSRSRGEIYFSDVLSADDTFTKRRGTKETEAKHWLCLRLTEHQRSPIILGLSRTSDTCQKDEPSISGNLLTI